jgi:hypothetical protein
MDAPSASGLSAPAEGRRLETVPTNADTTDGVLADQPTSSTDRSGEAPSATALKLAGEFKGADSFHFGRGRASIIEVAPGQFSLRFDDFSVRNGPDLYVYLSTNPTGLSPDAINLGKLKATDGSFNYDVPNGTDLANVRSVVVWCRPFAVLFASATLTRTAS